MNLADIKINPKDSDAINFVRFRYAIESELSGRKNKRGAKMLVVQQLGGRVIGHIGHKKVLFNDGTEARF